MKRNAFAAVAVAILFFAAVAAFGQDGKTTPYPKMAPLEQYLMERDAEITLAKSAAPASISGDADIMVLGKSGYETAVKGKNGFVCMVQRSWTAPTTDPNFWNPKLRAPICFNAAAVRSYLPLTLKKTELVLAGKSREEMSAAISAAIDKKELPTQERGAMSYMMSKEGYLGDGAGHWHPHLMFFVAKSEHDDWGAGLDGSPILAADDPMGRLTVFLIPVGAWSDGTQDR
jgi:hypothetical protein